MSAPLAKTDLVFKLATSQSYIDHSYDPTPDVGAQPAPRGLLRLIGDGLASLTQGIRNWASQQATLSEMGMMSDRELSKIRTRIGMVFQHFALWPHLTVLQNLMEAPVQVQRRPKAAANRAHAAVSGDRVRA